MVPGVSYLLIPTCGALRIRLAQPIRVPGSRPDRSEICQRGDVAAGSIWPQPTPELVVVYDREGETLDIAVQPRRDIATTLKLVCKLLKKQGFAPGTFVTAKVGLYSAAYLNLDIFSSA